MLPKNSATTNCRKGQTVELLNVLLTLINFRSYDSLETAEHHI